MSIPEIVSVAKAKAHLSDLLKAVQRGTLHMVINRSEPIAILMSVEHYKALLERVEDLEDGLAVLEGRLESLGQPTRPFDDVMRGYWAEHPEEPARVPR